MCIVITKVINNRVAQYQPCATIEEAEAHQEEFGGLIYEGEYTNELYVDGETVTIQLIPETPEQIIARLEGVIDSHLDAVAQSYRYESIRTMVTYAASDHPKFGPEGRAAVKFRDAVYGYGYDKIEACTREVDPDPIPTEAELLTELPSIQDFFE